mgnify:CR=1 FL=1
MLIGCSFLHPLRFRGENPSAAPTRQTSRRVFGKPGTNEAFESLLFTVAERALEVNKMIEQKPNEQ